MAGKKDISRLLPIFAAGFLATAALVGGVSTVMGTLSGAAARLVAEPVIEIAEIVAGLIGGAAAARVAFSSTAEKNTKSHSASPSA